jgi:hypothetical protein
MDNKIIFLLVVLAFIIYNSQSYFTPISYQQIGNQQIGNQQIGNQQIGNQQIGNQQIGIYTNEPIINSPKSCDFKNEYRVYPSGKVPGIYLGLSQREKDTLFKKFVEYQQPIELEGN